MRHCKHSSTWSRPPLVVCIQCGLHKVHYFLEQFHHCFARRFFCFSVCAFLNNGHKPAHTFFHVRHWVLFPVNFLDMTWEKTQLCSLKWQCSHHARWLTGCHSLTSIATCDSKGCSSESFVCCVCTSTTSPSSLQAKINWIWHLVVGIFHCAVMFDVWTHGWESASQLDDQIHKSETQRTTHTFTWEIGTNVNCMHWTVRFCAFMRQSQRWLFDETLLTFQMCWHF